MVRVVVDWGVEKLSLCDRPTFSARDSAAPCFRASYDAADRHCTAHTHTLARASPPLPRQSLEILRRARVGRVVFAWWWWRVSCRCRSRSCSSLQPASSPRSSSSLGLSWPSFTRAEPARKAPAVHVKRWGAGREKTVK